MSSALSVPESQDQSSTKYSSSDQCISIESLSASYSSISTARPVLHNLSFEIKQGSLCALLGANGAGKTTLLRCLTGLLSPQAGSLKLWGKKPDTERRQRIGVSLESPGIYRKLSAKEYLHFFGRFYAIENLDAVIIKLAKDFDLSLDNKAIGDFSPGNAQKLQLIRSLLHSPELVLWDEPNANLDPLAQEVVRLQIKRLISEGKTVLLATHQLEYAKELADQILLLSNGEKRFFGTLKELLALQSHSSNLEIQFATPMNIEIIKNCLKELSLTLVSPSGDENVFQIQLEGLELHCKTPLLISRLVAQEAQIQSVGLRQRELLDIFKELTSAA